MLQFHHRADDFQRRTLFSGFFYRNGDDIRFIENPFCFQRQQLRITRTHADAV